MQSNLSDLVDNLSELNKKERLYGKKKNQIRTRFYWV